MLLVLKAVCVAVIPATTSLANPGFNHCDLCYDKECTECSDYFSGDCLASRCSATSLAAATGSGTCSCNVGAFRADD